MPTTNLSFAKIVATPTRSSWSQAYNAGSLFIALSLFTENEDHQDELASHGKELLNRLEAEFFTLEDKSFASVEQAITTALDEPFEDITLSVTITYIKEDILYAFILGSGRVSLKRDGKIGTILEGAMITNTQLISSSGYLETNDIVLLQTRQFIDSVPSDRLSEALEYDLPNDIAETLSPHIHEGYEGGAAAIILSYKGAPRIITPDPDEEEIIPAASHVGQTESLASTHKVEEQDHNRDTREEHHEPSLALELDETTSEKGAKFVVLNRLKDRLPRLALPSIRLSRRHQLFLSLAVVLTGLLLVSVYLTRVNKEEAERKALFQAVYTAAKEEYEKGEGLLSINAEVARDSYLAARETLAKAQGKLKPGTTEAQKIAELETLITNRLEGSQETKSVKATEAEPDASPVLSALQTERHALAATEDEDNVYVLTSSSVIKLDKSSGKKETIITNEGKWNQAKGIGVFSGNVYVLDQAEGVLKFVPTKDGYASSPYFQDGIPDTSRAVSLAIDGSIYILFADGSVSKYTRGMKDAFSISGVERKLTSPTAIISGPELDHLYLLDNSSSRIVVVDKNGRYQEEYQVPQLKGATALSVSLDEKTIYFLSSGKLYQFSR